MATAAPRLLRRSAASDIDVAELACPAVVTIGQGLVNPACPVPNTVIVTTKGFEVGPVGRSAF